LRHLLQHRAGIGDYGSLRAYHDAVGKGEEPWPVDVLLSRVPPLKLLFAPGSGWSYSNIGYLFVRRLIEETCGSDLREALADLVLAPLGIRHAHVAKTRADMNRTAFAAGHGYSPGWVYHGVVVGPVVEAALALHRLQNGDLLSPVSRAAMLDMHPNGGALPGRPWITTGYGLGLMMGTMRRNGMLNPLAVLGHSAGGPGSVGAVYHTADGGAPRTVAVFAAEATEGVVEDEALYLLTRG
jgi:CubicO group peptidase (beta-lactamase class C family)